MEIFYSYLVDADWLLLVTCVLMIISATWLAFRGSAGSEPQRDVESIPLTSERRSA